MYPERSENKTVTCFLSLWVKGISLDDFGEDFKSWPHSLQKLKLEGFKELHLEQTILSLVPHSPQNFASPEFSVPQLFHCIVLVPEDLCLY